MNKKHGHCARGKRTKEWRAWNAMIRRCKYPTMERFPRYGGRGITVCQRWQESFENFLTDLGLAPSPEYSLGRINNDGNYEPDNVEWQTPQQQRRNASYNRWITFAGKTLTIGEWAVQTGIKRRTIQMRLDSCHWSIEKTLTTMIPATACPPRSTQRVS